MAAADKSLAKGRDFTKGKEAFSAARCIVCHRYGDDGGATGPDLTQAGGRFQVKDLVEAIVMPSKVVSDQYRASVVQTTDGKTLTGRIVSENPRSLIVVTDPEDATKFVELERTKIEEIAASLESLMPRELLNQLSEEEVLDLLAFTLARGKADDPRFVK
jgi:putative heme-binding domain-containing protein